MSIHTITCDEFMELSSAHHKLALRLYAAETNALIERLAATPDKTSAAYEATSEELGHLLTLRKLHKVRLEELAEDETYVPAPSAAAQYLENERQPLAA